MLVTPPQARCWRADEVLFPSGDIGGRTGNSGYPSTTAHASLLSRMSMYDVPLMSKEGPTDLSFPSWFNTVYVFDDRICYDEEGREKIPDTS